MVFVSAKKIKGTTRYYLEKSVRLPNGKIRKFSIYLKDYSPNGGYSGMENYNMLLNSKIHKGLVEFAPAHYKKSALFNAELLKRLEEIKLGYKGILKKITKKQLQDIIDRFTVNFTYESNAIEGSSLTLKDVALILHEKKVAEAKDLREIYETLNTREAMDLVFNNKLRINEKDIIKLHRIIVKNTGVAYGYKSLPNFIMGRNLKTALPESVGKEMRRLIKWYHENENTHPLQRASIFHGRFEKIHPFDDGNGRVGRLLINIILVNNHYPPLIIRKTQRISYFACLEAFDKGYEDKLHRFLVEKYKKTYEKFFKIYVKYI
ncbi:MAG: Fic family protein [Nanoarchaeota archaeon]